MEYLFEVSVLCVCWSLVGNLWSFCIEVDIRNGCFDNAKNFGNKNIRFFFISRKIVLRAVSEFS